MLSSLYSAAHSCLFSLLPLPTLIYLLSCLSLHCSPCFSVVLSPFEQNSMLLIPVVASVFSCYQVVLVVQVSPLLSVYPGWGLPLGRGASLSQRNWDIERRDGSELWHEAWISRSIFDYIGGLEAWLEKGLGLFPVWIKGQGVKHWPVSYLILFMFWLYKSLTVLTEGLFSGCWGKQTIISSDICSSFVEKVLPS